MLLLIPKELIFEISSYLSYKNIKLLCSINLYLYNLKDRLIKHKQRITKNYPRLEGKYKRHIIPENVINHKNLKQSMLEAKSLNLDLVRGDIVEFNPHEYWSDGYAVIYNGENLEELDYNTGGEADLTKDYQIIEDDVPIDYWYDNYYIIHFNIDKVKDQCINNVYQKDDDWYTRFLYNGESYDIKLVYNKLYKCDYKSIVFIFNDALLDNDYYLDYDDMDKKFILMDISLSKYYTLEETIRLNQSTFKNDRLEQIDGHDNGYKFKEIPELPGYYLSINNHQVEELPDDLKNLLNDKI